MTPTDIKNHVAKILQHTIANMGPIPDCTGHAVKEILGHDNPHDLMTLGQCLMRCRDANSYDKLIHQYDPNREDVP